MTVSQRRPLKSAVHTQEPPTHVPLCTHAGEQDAAVSTSQATPE